MIVETPVLSRRGIFRMQELGLLVILGGLYLGLTVAGTHFPSRFGPNSFLNSYNQLNSIATPMSEYAIMAVGMTCVIITGGIDISVGAIFGMSVLGGATILQYMSPDAPWYEVLPVAFFVPVAIGTACGVANGVMIVGLRIHSFIVTLGTLSILRGLCVILFPASVPWGDRELPQSFVKVMSYGFEGVNEAKLRLVPTLVMIAVVVCGMVFLRATIAGRETYAIGGNAEAARFSGIRVWWATLRVYLLMGLCCGVAAFVHLGRFFAAATNDGEKYELKVIAAAVVGGASLTGGRGTALGALLGTWIICLIENAIYITQRNSSYTDVIVGGSIIVAASLDRLAEDFRKKQGAAA